MSSRGSSRRDFLKLSSAGVAGAALSVSASSYARILGANDRVGIAIVGFSDRTRSSLIPSFVKVAGELNFELVALSDIWNRRRDEGAAYIAKLSNKQVALARNNEELYENKEVQAVIVGTADFQHAYHGVEAIHAGRDAYVEKPLAHTMEDARAIRTAVKGSDRVFAVGTQRRR
jgi:predicted dehydrogenase